MSSEELDLIGDEADGKGSSPGINSLISYNRKLRDSIVEARTAHQQEVRELKDRIRELEQFGESADLRVQEAQRSFQQERERHETEKLEIRSAMEQARQILEDQSQAQLDTIKVLQMQVDNLAGNLSKAESRGGSLDRLKYTLLEKARALKSELTEVKTERDELNAELETLMDERDGLRHRLDSLADSIAKLDELEQQNLKLQAAIDSQEAEFLKAKAYAEQAEAREMENMRLAALAEEKVRLADSAVKAQEDAERQAFESRRKLLDLYAQEEAKEILKDNLDSTQAELTQTQESLAQALAQLADWEKKYEELENKLLYSSERDILKRSLANLAQRKSLGNS